MGAPARPMDAIFPTTDPVLIVAIAAVTFLVAPLVTERLRMPGILGLILAGALVGPNGLMLLRRDATIELLGTVGLVYLMFVVGLELDLVGFARHRNRSFLFGGISFVLPFALAIPVMTGLGFTLPAAMLAGAVVGSHTLLAYPVATRLGIQKDPAVTSVVGGTLLTDGLSLGVLAVIDAAASGAQGAAFWLRFAGTLALYLAAAVWVVPRLGRWFFRNAEGESTTRFFFLLAILFVSAYTADIAGAQPIIGAFLAGLLLNRLIPDQSPLMTRVRFFGNAFFIPFFLFSVGMLFDVRALLAGPRVIVLAVALSLLVLIGKGGGALLSGRLLGFNRDQSWVMAGLSVPQAAATLAVTFVGLEIGLFDADVVSAVIVLILVSSLVGATLVERVGRAVARAAEAAPYRPDTAPHRILVPLANPTTADTLMDVAFLIRAPGSTEPVYPLTVVSDDAEAPSHVARAERMLAHAVVYGAEADVPINPLTRVAQNPAAGVARAVSETRITDIVIGWTGRSTAIPRVIFGNVIDQTLHLTDPQILVCRLFRPVTTQKRIVAILPPFVDHNPGFFQAARTLKTLASKLGLAVHALAAADAPTDAAAARLELRVGEVQPEIPSAFELVDGWSALRTRLRETVTADDLVFVISARQGTLAHSFELERLPTELSRLDVDFIVAYPSELPPQDRPRHDVRGLPRHLTEERVLFDLDAADHVDAVHKLLATSIAEGGPRERVAEAVLADAPDQAAEVLPGVLIFHGRAPGVREPWTFFGIDREGLPHPRSEARVHGVCLLVSPVDASIQGHLATLAEIAEQIAHAGGSDALKTCSTMEDLRNWFGIED